MYKLDLETQSINIEPNHKEYEDDLLYLFWNQVSNRPTIYIISHFLNKLLVYVGDQSNRIALGTLRRRERRIVDFEANKTYDADEIVIHYNGVKESAAGIEKIIVNCINQSNSKSKIPTSISIVTSFLENTNMDMNTIMIEVQCDSLDISDSGSNPKNISFRFIDTIDKIINYPNENIMLFENISIVYRFDKSI